MRSAFILLQLVGLAAFASAPASAGTGAAKVNVPADERMSAAVDALVQRAIREWHAPGVAVTVVRDGKVVLARGYGTRDLDTRAPMTASTLFPIQSETKAFTAATVAALASDGRIDLDAPARDYLPSLRLKDGAADHEVTLRDFLTHRSGLGQYGWLWLTNPVLTRADAVSRVPYLPPRDEFRANFHYSNIGYVLASRAVETVSGKSWEQFLEERLLAPLGMTRTTTSQTEANADPNHIAGSMWLWGRYRRTPMQGTTPLTNSAGGIYSTAEDMGKWLIFQLGDGSYGGKTLISPKLFAETHASQVVTKRPVPEPEFTSSDYGLGWYVDSYRGHRVIDHQGNHWGVSSSAGVIPDQKLGVSVFVNQDGDLAAFLMFAIVDQYLGSGGRDWLTDMKPAPPQPLPAAPKPVKLPAAQLQAYVGSYDFPGFGTVRVSLSNGGLHAKYYDDSTVLQCIGPDLFIPTTLQFGNIWSMQEGQKVRFVRDFGGKVTGLTISSAEDGVVFKRLD